MKSVIWPEDRGIWAGHYQWWSPQRCTCKQKRKFTASLFYFEQQSISCQLWASSKMSLRPFKMHDKSNNLWNARQILPTWKVKSMEISMKKLTTTHVMYRIFREWRPSKFCVLRLDMREQRGVGSRDRLDSRHPHLRYNIFKYTNIFSQPNKPMHTFHHFDSHSLT